MFIDITKRVLKRVLKDKEDNLVRLNFDYYYSKKKLNALGGKDGKAKAQQEIADLEKQVAQERLKGKDKSKTQITYWENQIAELRNKIQLLIMFSNDVAEARNALILGKSVAEELKQLLKINPNKIYEENKDII